VQLVTFCGNPPQKDADGTEVPATEGGEQDAIVMIAAMHFTLPFKIEALSLQATLHKNKRRPLVNGNCPKWCVL